MIKILAIGNSFSQDATALLQFMSDEIVVRNLYIGGCTLQKHCENAANDASAYDFEENGAILRKDPISIKDALLSDKWDYVTVQQASGLSGIYESYYPYITELSAYVRKFTDAEIVFHRTWAYEKDSTHGQFADYDNSQQKMWECIKRTTDRVAAQEKLRIIDVGGAVQDLRALPAFDYGNGGLSLNRDGFHLSFNYGRFIAAAVWCKFFTGKYPAMRSGSLAFATIKKYFEKKEAEEK